jgi:hypothetical protein
MRLFFRRTIMALVFLAGLYELALGYLVYNNTLRYNLRFGIYEITFDHLHPVYEDYLFAIGSSAIFFVVLPLVYNARLRERGRLQLIDAEWLGEPAPVVPKKDFFARFFGISLLIIAVIMYYLVGYSIYYLLKHHVYGMRLLLQLGVLCGMTLQVIYVSSMLFSRKQKTL